MIMQDQIIIFCIRRESFESLKLFWMGNILYMFYAKMMYK